MAKVSFAGGVALDLATTDDLASTADSIVDKLAAPSPAPLRFTQSAIRTGQLSDPIDLGSPPLGRLWYVLAVTVSGGDAFTNPAGNPLVALFVGDLASAGSPLHLRLPALAVPQTRSANTRAMWVMANESLYAMTSSVNTTVTICITCQIEEWKMADVNMQNPGFTPLT